MTNSMNSQNQNQNSLVSSSQATQANAQAPHAQQAISTPHESSQSKQSSLPSTASTTNSTAGNISSTNSKAVPVGAVGQQALNLATPPTVSASPGPEVGNGVGNLSPMHPIGLGGTVILNEVARVVIRRGPYLEKKNNPT